MLNSNSERRILKKDLKRRMIELLIFIPAGVGFAVLFFYMNFSFAVQMILTIVCWGTVIAITELIIWLVKRSLEKKNAEKPKKRDPFAD